MVFRNKLRHRPGMTAFWTCFWQIHRIYLEKRVPLRAWLDRTTSEYLFSPKLRNPLWDLPSNFLMLATIIRAKLMLQKLQDTDWSPVFAENNVNNATSKFYCLVHKEFKTCFPSMRAKMSSKDPPFMSPLLKHLSSKRDKLLRKGPGNGWHWRLVSYNRE